MSRYKPYPKYQDSGVEWLGQVPEEWPVIRVGYGYDVVLGKMLQPLVKEAEDRLVPYLKAVNVQWENITGEPSEMWASDAEIQKFSIRKGDLLVCEGGEVGRCALVPYHPDSVCIIQNSLHRVRAVKGCDITYLLRCLETANAASWFDILCNKATIAHFTRDKFVSLRIPAPDIDTQKKITEFLNQECAHIDTIISKQEHLIELLEEKRIALISHAVTKGLNPDCEMKDSGIAWVGSIPKHWELLRTKHLFEIKKRIVGTLGFDVLAITQKGIQIKDIEANTGQFSMDYSKYQLVERGDFAMNHMDLLTGFVDISNYEGVTSPDYRVFSKRDKTDHVPLYFLYIFQNAYLNKIYYALGQGVSNFGRWRLPAEQFNDFVLPVPPEDEQKAIVDFLEEELFKISTIIEKTKQAIALAQERRAAIISAAVTGKICVSRQQSAEKPLSRSREYFQKVVLAAEITSQLHQERTFGRVKLQKILFLSEYHAQLPFQRSEYQRYAAGPHDPKAMYSIEGQMKKQKWFDSRLRESGYGKEYVPLERHEAYKQYYERYFADSHAAIQRIIDLLRPRDTQFCEVVATLYGVWNDFLLAGQQPSDADMFREAVTNWHDKKREIPTGLWPKALHWMRENDLVPTGWGEPTIHRQET